MTSHKEQLSSTGYRDWVRAGLATKYLREGIVLFIDETVKQQHSQILTEIQQKQDTVISGCSERTLKTLLPEHTKYKETKKCPLDHRNCNCLNENGRTYCPNVFCSTMYDKIINQHRFHTPNWRNTDIRQWYSNHWEIAKCNIPNRIYGDTAADSDCSGLLNVVCNSLYVPSAFDSKIGEVGDVVFNVRKIRNEIFHSSDMELDEGTLKTFIDDMIDVLKYLCNRREALNAKEKLMQLQNENIVVTTSDEYEMLQMLLETFRSGAPSGVLLQMEKRLQQLEEVTSKMLSVITKTDQENHEQTIKDSDSTTSDVWHDQSTTEQVPSFSRPHDGRLITLKDQQLTGLMSNCEKKVIQGGFGDVYISKDKVPGLDVRVVIKKIVCEGDDEIKMFSVSNEKVASRIMHFAIVPLIAYMERELHGNKREFYFISPYLERGNLFEIVTKDKLCINSEDILLQRYRRIHILFQIACAIDYLHTPVPGSRGIVLHMDLTTTNIVLDDLLNARLIDFGLAREMNEGQTKASYTQSKIFGTRGYFPTVRYSALTIYEDYYNFGVVIRELLTGREPYRKSGNQCIELRKESEDYIRKILQDNIWSDSQICQEALDLVRLSKACLESRGKNVTSLDLVDKLKSMCQGQWSRAQEDKCDLCIVNDAVKPEQSPIHPCRMKVCVSCMRNSHVNPIKCHTCNEDVIPKIGHTYSAVLIAGNDIENEALAKSSRKEVKQIKDVLISKYPCVLGIREENVSMVVPSNPGKADILLPQLRTTFASLQAKMNLDTLLVYFTGHHSLQTGFMLGSSTDILTLGELRDALQGISKGWGKTPRILVFFDCCNPPSVGSIPELSNEYVKIIQINACKHNEISAQPLSGSKFQKFFIQALTRRLFNKRCYNSGQVCGNNPFDDKCKDCKMDGDFISVEKLLAYISDHMKKCVSGREPVMYANGINWLDTSIGYNIDVIVDLTVKLEIGQETARTVPLRREVYCDIMKYKKCILETFIDNCDFHEKLQLTPVQFADALALRIQTGSQDGTELRSMLNVSAAWDAKREIIVSYRTVSSILKGRVVCFMPTKCISQYLQKKRLIKNETDGEEVAKFSLKELDRLTDEIKQDIGSLENSQKGKEELDRFHTVLLNVYEKWRHGKEQQYKELKVIFPRLNCDRWQEFVVLDLSVGPRKSLLHFDKMERNLDRNDLIIPVSVLVLIVAFVFVFCL